MVGDLWISKFKTYQPTGKKAKKKKEHREVKQLNLKNT